MAMVQKFQRAVSVDRADRRPAVVPDMDQLFKAVVQPATAPTVAAMEAPRDHDTAFDILDQAASAFDSLTSHMQQLEANLADAKAKLQSEAERHEAMTGDWNRLAEGMRAHARECEQRMAAATAKAETAEAKYAEALIRAEAAELQCANLQNRSTRLHDKVVASFGIGSRAQLMLEAIQSKSDAAPDAAVH